MTEDLQLPATANFKADHVDAYDSDCDDEATTNAIFMANLSPVGSINDETVKPRYDSDILFEVPHYDTYHDSDMLNSNIQELGYIENIISNNESCDELMSNNNVISYTDYMLTIGNDDDNYVPPLIVEIVLWYLDSRCSKHMTGHRDKLINFVSKFIAMVRFGNDHFATIMRYGDLQMGNILISRVYYVEGLSHNLFSVGQFCDSYLKVAFRKHTCFVWNLEGVNLLLGSRGSNLYTISMVDMMKSSTICLLSKASKTKSWLWHRHFLT
ncbi:hypothetical protein Tco_0749925 [Tanacetum coccineum]|uniref:Retrovirus-related Pol polyprotein from transposon TNT 1-94-like beta-barrel domain-containing protein n=1 Tax=Tanacetum coccineum TaxID=301880 RepID=A0ABQ4YZW1_9ASTR